MLAPESNNRVGRVTAEQARQMKVEPVDHNSTAYESIFENCMRRITAVAEKEDCCFFTVPPFHLGLTSYDPDIIFQRLYDDLTGDGFLVVAWKESRKMLIIWTKDEKTLTNILSDNI